MSRSASTQPENRKRRSQATRRPRSKNKASSASKSEPKRPYSRSFWVAWHCLLLAAAIFSWSWCLDLFSSPEQPGHYGFLKQSGLLPDLLAYSPLEAPAGENCPAQRLHQRHAQLSDEKLEALNRQFLRDFLRNYQKADKRLYLTGEYEVRGSRALTEQDPVTRGLLVKLRAQLTPDGGAMRADYPLELLWLLPETDASADDFPSGTLIDFNKSPDCLTPLHLSVDRSGAFTLVRASAISLAYGERDSPGGRSISTTPPESLRLRNPWPDENPSQ